MFYKGYVSVLVLSCLAMPACWAAEACGSGAESSAALTAGTGKNRCVPVNINTADVETLSTRLLGVGRGRAAALVEWRERNGPFSSLQQLDAVKGFGPGLIERNRDRIIFQE